MVKPTDHHAELFEFVLEKAAQEPTRKRARLYRALAAYSGNPTEAANLKSIADSLESADHLCREFAFRFSEARDGKGAK